MWIILGIFKEICLHFSYKYEYCVIMWKIVPSTCYVSRFPLSLVELWITQSSAKNPILQTHCSRPSENPFSTCGSFSTSACGNAQNLWITVQSVVSSKVHIPPSLFLSLPACDVLPLCAMDKKTNVRISVPPLYRFATTFNPVVTPCAVLKPI